MISLRRHHQARVSSGETGKPLGRAGASPVRDSREHRFIGHFARPWPWLLMVAVAALSAWQWNRIDREAKVERELERELAVLGTSYRAGFSMYQHIASTLFDGLLRDGETLDLIADGIAADGLEQERLRRRLFRRLAAPYAHLQSQGVRQWQIFTPAGESFLRMHAPDKFGDSLIEARPSVRRVSEEHVPVRGFEVGRLMTGFRYIFPLFRQGAHVASAEISVGFRALRNAIEALAPTREYALVLDRAAIEAAVWPEQRALYEPTAFSTDLLREDPRLILSDTAPGSPTQHALDARLAGRPDLARQLASATPFAVALTHEDDDWIVAFLPIRDVLGRPAAWLLAYAQAPGVAAIEREFRAALAFALTAALLAGLAGWRIAAATAFQRRERLRLAVIMDTVGDALYVMDGHGRVTYANPVFGEIMGFTDREIVGRHGHAAFHSPPDAPGDGHCDIQAAVSAGVAFAGEQTFYRKDGAPLPVEVTSRPLFENGAVSGSVTAFRDLGAHKAAESELIAARQAAEAGSRAKSEFLAHMSHELRTPLNAVLGFSQLLADDETLPAATRDQIGEIGVAGRHLLALVNDVIDLARIEAGRMTLCLEAMPVAEVLAEVRRLAEPLAAARGVRLDETQCTCEVAGLQVFADRQRLRQVVLNLLSNAVKYNRPGGRVALSCGRADGRCRIAVADTGPGIAPEKQARLFTAFDRLGAEGSNIEGVGIGLTIARSMAEAMGGTLGFESRLGEGSCFWVELPFIEGQAASVPLAATCPVIDDARLDEVADGDTALACELLGLFAASLDELKERIIAAAAAREAALVALAHDLKGSSANLGAARLAELGRNMEAAAKAQAWVALDAAVAMLDDEIGRFKAAAASHPSNMKTALILPLPSSSSH